MVTYCRFSKELNCQLGVKECWRFYALKGEGGRGEKMRERKESVDIAVNKYNKLCLEKTRDDKRRREKKR